MLSMMTMYGAYPAIPYANAVNALVDAKETLTDSDPGALSDHEFTFTNIATELVTGDEVEITMDALFDGYVPGDVTCPTGFDALAEVASNVTTCIVAATTTIATGTVNVLTIADVTNPVADMYTTTIKSSDGAGTVYDQIDVMTAIVDNVLMTARVTSTLNFTISGTSTAAVVNGVTCGIDTSASSTLLDFGTLSTTASSTLCQELKVVTNADDGYSVVVYQDDELRSDGDSTINSFRDALDGTGTTTPQAWVSPAGTIDEFNTYGHMGLTSDDLSLAAGDTFGATFDSGLYVGFDGYGSANAVEVMYHDASADGSTIDKGMTYVAYTTEISALQEAGDYETVLTYIATPTY